MPHDPTLPVMRVMDEMQCQSNVPYAAGNRTLTATVTIPAPGLNIGSSGSLMS
jgi:hypothetical protein